MKINNLSLNSTVYTSNVYLVTGTKNDLASVNTLVDVGRDPDIIQKIYEASTGVGKKRIEQVVLTHCHYDHSSLLSRIRQDFNPVVCAWAKSLDGVDRYLKDGEHIKIGDCMLEVMYAPFHSSDSIMLYSEENKLLFTGDNELLNLSGNGTHPPEFSLFFKKLCMMDVDAIYPGHGKPIVKGVGAGIIESARNIGGVKYGSVLKTSKSYNG